MVEGLGASSPRSAGGEGMDEGARGSGLKIQGVVVVEWGAAAAGGARERSVEAVSRGFVQGEVGSLLLLLLLLLLMFSSPTPPTEKGGEEGDRVGP